MAWTLVAALVIGAPVKDETAAQAEAARRAHALGAHVWRAREDGPVVGLSFIRVRYRLEDLRALRALPLEEIDLAEGPADEGDIDLTVFPRLRRITFPARFLPPRRRWRLGKGVSEVAVNDGMYAAGAMMRVEAGPGSLEERRRESAKKVIDGLFSLIDGLDDLRALNIAGMRLTEAEVDRIARYPNLRALKVGPLTWRGWLEFKRLGRLESLDIESPPTLAVLRSMRGLRRLRLQLEGVPRDELPALAGLSSLEELDIGYVTHCGDAALRHLAGLKRLRKLSAAAIGPEGMAHIGRLTGLEEADLMVQERGVDLVALSGLKRLRSLRLTGGEKMTNAEFAGVQALKGLERLDVQCIHVTARKLDAVSRLPRLRELILPSRGDYADHLALLRGSPVERLKAQPDIMTDAGGRRWPACPDCTRSTSHGPSWKGTACAGSARSPA